MASTTKISQWFQRLGSPRSRCRQIQFGDSPPPGLRQMVAFYLCTHQKFGGGKQKTISFFFSSAAQSCPTLCDPMDCSTPSLPVCHSQSLLKLMSIKLAMPSNHLILCRPLLLPPSIFPRISVFSNESALPIRWPK